MSYYLGGYYLIKERPVDPGQPIFTCSNCINDSLLDSWSYSWVSNNNSDIKDIYNNFKIDGITIIAIRKWVDENFEDKTIGWINVFYDLKTLRSYQRTFFSHLPDLLTMSIYFSENETKDLIDEFKPNGPSANSIGLFDSLSKKIIEDDSEIFIGYDLIGIEWSGDFHTFHCHDLAIDLFHKFGLKLNDYGLFDHYPDWTSVLEYMNNEETGLEPVPWFVIKVKLVSQ